MALREVRHVPDSVLRKMAKPVTEVTPRIRTLIKDMFNTMDYEDGIGLAAPQVGILKRIFTVGIGDIRMAFINPEVLSTEGEYLDVEGCLSIPGENGVVKRPTYVKVKAMNEEGKTFIIEAKYLLARCILHELDHLNGVLFTDKLEDVEEDFETEEQEEDLLISLNYVEGE